MGRNYSHGIKWAIFEGKYVFRHTHTHTSRKACKIGALLHILNDRSLCATVFLTGWLAGWLEEKANGSLLALFV